TDSAGPGTSEWSSATAWVVLGGLAAALAASWALLDRLTDRSGGRPVLLALAVAAAGSGLTVMLSGYATGGMLGLPLAAGLAGAAAASLLLAGKPDLKGAVGVGVVGLFALLVVGRFFGSLSTAHAALLFAAPLLAWLGELPWARRAGPRLRALAATA